MLRNFRFRFWAEDMNGKGKMHYMVDPFFSSCPFATPTLCLIPNYVAQQETGYKDRNSIDIYEGDYLLFDSDSPERGNDIFEVFFADGSYMLKNRHNSSIELMSDFCNFKKSDCEIVGNCFEGYLT